MAARSKPIDPKKVASLALLMIVLAIVALVREFNAPAPAPAPPVEPGEYLFCAWNVENLFDDIDDKRSRDDEEYDTRYSQNPQDLQLKLQKLTEAILRMNDGKGPDILAITEVESKRAAQLLADALNKSLPTDAKPYTTVAMEEVAVGRHIAPAVISRLPLNPEYPPRLPNKVQRILVVGLMAAGHELTVYATHWTSRRSDETGDKRAKYADLVYGDANRIYTRNPKADIIVCGDFNDTPDDPAVREHLRTGDLATVRNAHELRFFNLMAGKDPTKYATHYYNKPLIYDHIVIAPGLLDDQGWTCDVDSIQAVHQGLSDPKARGLRPWRFGDAGNKTPGYSDHFPVTVKLRVSGSEISK